MKTKFVVSDSWARGGNIFTNTIPTSLESYRIIINTAWSHHLHTSIRGLNIDKSSYWCFHRRNQSNPYARCSVSAVIYAIVSPPFWTNPRHKFTPVCINPHDQCMIWGSFMWNGCANWPAWSVVVGPRPLVYLPPSWCFVQTAPKVILRSCSCLICFLRIAIAISRFCKLLRVLLCAGKNRHQSIQVPVR